MFRNVCWKNDLLGEVHYRLLVGVRGSSHLPTLSSGRSLVSYHGIGSKRHNHYLAIVISLRKAIEKRKEESTVQNLENYAGA